MLGFTRTREEYARRCSLSITDRALWLASDCQPFVAAELGSMTDYPIREIRVGG